MGPRNFLIYKEIWFRPHLKPRLDAGELTTTFRELVDPKKNNDYKPDELVLGRIVHYARHADPRFDPEEYVLRIRDVPVLQIGTLTPRDFELSDAASRTDLKNKFEGYYEKIYTDESKVRKILFEILQKRAHAHYVVPIY